LAGIFDKNKGTFSGATAGFVARVYSHVSIGASSRKMSFIDRSVEWIISHFNINNKTEIADFGCGPGLYTTRLDLHGAIVSGVDFSKNSLKYSKQVKKQKGLSINYFHTNYLEFETTQRFDLITMILCAFCALSPKQRKILGETTC